MSAPASAPETETESKDAQIMRTGYSEIIASYAASARRSKNRNAEIALERVVAALSHITTETLMAKGAERK